MIELNAASIAGGGLVERLNDEIHKAVANCLDVNTEAKKTRTVTLKLKIKPDETRYYASVSVETSSTLCPPEPLTTGIYMATDMRTGEVKVSEAFPGEDPEREVLPGVENTTSKITKFQGTH